MKRLAVIVKPENVDGKILSLREMGLEATIYVKGAGKDKQRVASGRGSSTLELVYASRKVDTDRKSEEFYKTCLTLLGIYAKFHSK